MFSKQKIYSAAITALISLSALFPSCSSDKPLRPEVQSFREQMLTDFNLLQSRLVPVLEKDKPVDAAADVIENFLLELKNNDRRIFSIGLLDKSGEYLTGFVTDSKNTGKLIKDKYKNMDFHSFKVVEKIINSERILQEQLYLQDSEILGIGFPIVKDGDFIGILCFTFKTHEFKKKWGISEKEFLKIDFGKV